jgi:Ala-tRNA(Pro) deacylase
LAKTVIVKLDGKMVMAVLPASYQVDLQLLKMAAGAQEARLATEEDFKNLFPECELGAMPPFGNLCAIEVYVAPPLTEDKEISLTARSPYELIKLAYEEFDRLVCPKVANFSRRINPSPQSLS